MPAQLTYPGVYIEEIPSGVRTIVGVATSITAFIGTAKRGPSNEATIINSYADFERIFGGLWTNRNLKSAGTMGFAVKDFYLNGGSQAVIVRLYRPETGDGAKPSKAHLVVGGMTLVAANEGSWGMNLRATVDLDVSEDVAKRMGLEKADLFNLTVKELNDDGSVRVSEKFVNLSLKNSSRRIDNVLEAQSNLVRWYGTFPPSPMPTIAAGSDAVTTAEKNLADEKSKANPSETRIAELNQALNSAKSAMESSDGLDLIYADFVPDNAFVDKRGLYALEQTDLFNILCIPPHLENEDVDPKLISDAATYCETRRAMLIVDPLSEWDSIADVIGNPTATPPTGISTVGTNSKNAAIFFPRIKEPNPLNDGQLEDFAPCGAIAGIFARTDTTRGVWKAPAGLDATLVGVSQLSFNMTDMENGQLNQIGVNCLRTMPAAGRVVWGSRTMQGADRLASEWKYIPVRRLALFIEESLYRGTQWVVFEPNDEPLWAQIRLNVGAFMHNLFRQGAFQGGSPQEAYFVKCDKETTPQAEINLGIVNILVGFAPLKPAEFVVIKIQQMAGQIQT